MARVRFAMRCDLHLIIVSMLDNLNDIIANLDENIAQIIEGHRVNGLTENDAFRQYGARISMDPLSRRVKVY